MTTILTGFADELVKLSSSDGPMNVVAAEALGPLPSMIRGWKQGRKHGGVSSALKNSAKSGAGYIIGGGAGALAGLALAKLIAAAVGGRDLGVGSLTLGHVLPAVAGVLGGLEAEKFLARR